MSDRELVEQVAATLLGSVALRQGQARRILALPAIARALEIAQRYEEARRASGLELENGLGLLSGHKKITLSKITIYRLVPEQQEEG